MENKFSPSRICKQAKHAKNYFYTINFQLFSLDVHEEANDTLFWGNRLGGGNYKMGESSRDVRRRNDTWGEMTRWGKRYSSTVQLRLPGENDILNEVLNLTMCSEECSWYVLHRCETFSLRILKNFHLNSVYLPYLIKYM